MTASARMSGRARGRMKKTMMAGLALALVGCDAPDELWPQGWSTGAATGGDDGDNLVELAPGTSPCEQLFGGTAVAFESVTGPLDRDGAAEAARVSTAAHTIVEWSQNGWLVPPAVQDSKIYDAVSVRMGLDLSKQYGLPDHRVVVWIETPTAEGDYQAIYQHGYWGADDQEHVAADNFVPQSFETVAAVTGQGFVKAHELEWDQNGHSYELNVIAMGPGQYLHGFTRAYKSPSWAAKSSTSDADAIYQHYAWMPRGGVCMIPLGGADTGDL